MDIKSKTLTFHEARRPWDQWGIRETLGSVNARWSNCTPSDIDSVIELNGHFLFIEDKGDSNEQIGVGQILMYQRLIALSDKVTVWFLYGSKDNPTQIYSVRRDEFEPINHPQDVMNKIGQWADYVNTKSKEMK